MSKSVRKDNLFQLKTIYPGQLSDTNKQKKIKRKKIRPGKRKYR